MKNVAVVDQKLGYLKRYFKALRKMIEIERNLLILLGRETTL